MGNWIFEADDYEGLRRTADLLHRLRVIAPSGWWQEIQEAVDFCEGLALDREPEEA